MAHLRCYAGVEKFTGFCPPDSSSWASNLFVDDVQSITLPLFVDSGHHLLVSSVEWVVKWCFASESAIHYCLHRNYIHLVSSDGVIILIPIILLILLIFYLLLLFIFVVVVFILYIEDITRWREDMNFTFE